MAKYVCEFGAVEQAGKELCESASSMGDSITKMSKEAETRLESWQGEAKDSFYESYNALGNASVVNAVYLNNLGLYATVCARSIEGLDEALSGMSF